jgi:hypothetical protein
MIRLCNWDTNCLSIECFQDKHKQNGHFILKNYDKKGEA